jgi:hypothetical protein
LTNFHPLEGHTAVSNRTGQVETGKQRKVISKVGGLLLVPLAALAAVNPAYLERTFETTSNPRISLSNLAGHVTVTGWEKSQVHIASKTTSPQVEVDIDQLPSSGRAEKIHVVTQPLSPHRTGQDQSADYTLEVPVGSNLEIRNPEGTVRVEKIHGQASVDSVGGTIVASEISGHLSVRSIGGDIEVLRPSGIVEANSVNGSLRFVSPTGPQLRATTTSGKVFYEGDFLSGSNYHLSDYNGDMEILTPSSASFELSAKTVRGKVVADPELSVVPRKRALSPLYGGNSLLGTHNTGAASVELSSFSGVIRIRRLQ